VAHPGVGSPVLGEEKTEHRYYQWVCFTLFLQAILFRVPRAIWLTFEGRRMEKVVPKALLHQVSDLRMPAFAKPTALVEADVVASQLTAVLDFIKHYNSSRTHDIYFKKFVFCEVLNMVNVVSQIFFVDLFLGGMFSTYGHNVFTMSQADPEDRSDPMNLVFPKVGKCTFRRFGPTGTIETFDGLCVLPINILNEKIYIFLWFWFVLLAAVTGVYLLYRALTMALAAVRRRELQSRVHLLVPDDVTRRIANVVSAGEWFFLCQLGANLDPHFFAKLLVHFDRWISEKKQGGEAAAIKQRKSEKIA
jgi:hypothetical protein